MRVSNDKCVIDGTAFTQINSEMLARIYGEYCRVDIGVKIQSSLDLVNHHCLKYHNFNYFPGVEICGKEQFMQSFE